jgi:hypothetical protein
MKKLVLLAIMLACAIPLSAQNWTTVTASNITDLNQQKLATGQLCFLATDQNDAPISFNVGGGGQVLKRAFCSAVTNGTAALFTVPNPAGTTPAGIYYRVTVKDVNSGQEVLRYTQVSFTGATFNFDNYAPTNFGQFAPLTGTAVSGNLSVNGNLSITGSFSGSNFGLLGVQGLGINGATANSNAVNGPSGWTLQSGGTNEVTINSSGVTINNPSFIGNLTLPATGTATSGSNFGSITESWNGSYWNGTSAAADNWTAQSFLAAGTNPNSFLILNHSGSPGSFVQVNSALQIPTTTAATSGSNVNSPTLSLLGNYWTGSASNADTWGIQDVLGAGANPPSTLTLTHLGGSTGATTVDVSSVGTLKTGAINAAANAITAATFKSNSANAAASGQIELAANDAIKFRNNANTADVNALSKSASDVIQIGGGPGVGLSGSASGTTAIVAAATASGTLTLPAATDTLLGRATTDTLSNKTIDTASANVIKVNGNTLSAAAGSATVSIPAATDILLGRATTDTLTNKSIDAEAAGNTITLPFYVQIPAAGCNNATASPNWDLPTTNAPTPNCLTGTNTQQGTMDFDDTAARTMQTSFALSPGWTGNVDVDIDWLVTAGGGSNTVKFTVATACSAAAATFDPAFNAANTITSGTVGANNAMNVTSQTAITMTGCAAGNVLHIKFGRDNTDTSTATVRVVNVAFTIRRSM